VKLLKSALPLILGGGLGQVLNLLITPVLTRYYTSADFGQWALFLSISAVIITSSAFRYDVSILLPKSKVSSLLLSVISLKHVFLTTVISIVFCLFYTMVVDALEIIYLFLPVSIFVGGVNLILTANLNYQKKFKKLAIAKLFQTLFTISFNVIFIYVTSFEDGAFLLVFSTIIGQFVCLVMQMRGLDLSFKMTCRLLKTNYSAKLVKKNYDFALFSLPEVIIGSLLQGLPIYALTLYFTSDIAGQYSLAQRVLLAPVAIIGTSLSQVYFKHFSEMMAHGKNLYSELIQLWCWTFTLGLVPTIILTLYAQSIFPWLFGSSWQFSGVIISILAFPTLIRFVFTVGSSSHVVLRLQHYSLSFAVIVLLFKLLTSFWFNTNIINLLVSYAIIDTLAIFTMNGIALHNAKKGFCT
jgi:O-antigen/teichoic acid export membrane protein